MARTAVNSGYTVIMGSATGGNGAKVDVWVEYKVTEQSIADNKSYVRAYYYAQPNTKTGSYGANGLYSSVKVNGAAGTGVSNGAYDFRGTSSSYRVQWGSYAGWVSHSGDGSKKIVIEGEFETKSTYVSGGSVSGTVTLPTIPRGATLTAAPNFNDTDNPKITYSNPAGSVVTTLQACISFTGSADDVAYRDISKTGTSYTFSLTDAERTVLRKGTTGANSRTVYFFVKTVVGGSTFYSKLSKTFTILNPEPTLSPAAYDTNETTLALTGDKNKFIKYYSNVYTSSGAKAVKDATISKQSTTIGGVTKTAATNTFNKVEAADVKFSVTDNRNNITTQTLNKTLINYVKLTCNISGAKGDTDGNITFKIRGNYFNGSFGSVSNTLTLSYRYKEEGGTYSSWTTKTATKSGNTYSANVTISGLDYQKTYVIQARAVDKLATVNSDEKQVKTIPVFDWSKSDFKHNTQVIMSNGTSIKGISADGSGEKTITFISTADNLILGSRTEGYEPNNIYLRCADGGNICGNNSGTNYSLLGAAIALTTTYTCSCTAEAGANYSSVSLTADLIGNTLRCYLTATRSSASGTGNISNETVGTFTINHGGRIKSIGRVSFGNGSTGGVASFNMSSSSTSGDTSSFTVQLAAIGTSSTEFTSYFCIPCTLNLSNYV